MPNITIIPLGAGQDVGRSCILVSMGGKRIMLDCGLHMGFNDSRKYPDFSFITSTGRLSDYIDCVIISHFHLDHCGSLPYMTEIFGYDGPIYMTSPTKAISPILIEDMRRILAEKKLDPELFTSQMIKDCFSKVIEINLHEVIKVSEGLEIKAYYAGHVLGAAMFYIRAGKESLVYTGDFNMTSDCHLGAAWIDRCRPDVLISESTYATTIRESRRCRENDLLKKVHQIVDSGGKVLIPVFALGRAQELCLLLEQYWERKNIKVPIYMTTGMAEKAVNYYKLFITWTNQRLKNSFFKRNLFEFKHCSSFERTMTDNPGPMVVLASPGMLHAGTSFFIFKKWAADPKNAVILPGYCTAGTIGHKLLTGQKRIENEDRPGTFIEVNIQVYVMSFSAHADAVGILQLIDFCRPQKAVVFVHGEADKMKVLCESVSVQFNLKSFYPGNGEILKIETDPSPITALIPKDMISRFRVANKCRLHGLVSLEDHHEYPLRISNLDQIDVSNGEAPQLLSFSTSFSVNLKRNKATTIDNHSIASIMEILKDKILENHPKIFINDQLDNSIIIESVQLNIESTPLVAVKNSIGTTFNVNLSWNSQDQDIADSIFKLARFTFNKLS